MIDMIYYMYCVYICIYVYIYITYICFIAWQHGSRNLQTGDLQVIEGRTETLKDQLFNKAESNNVPWASKIVTSG